MPRAIFSETRRLVRAGKDQTDVSHPGAAVPNAVRTDGMAALKAA